MNCPVCGCNCECYDEEYLTSISSLDAAISSMTSDSGSIKISSRKKKIKTKFGTVNVKKYDDMKTTLGIKD